MPLRPATVKRRRDLPVVTYTHPLELAIAVALVVNGIRGALGALSPSVDALPTVPYFLYLLVSTAGGLAVTVGVIRAEAERAPGAGNSVHVVSYGPTLERAGLFLVASALLSFAIILIAANGYDGLGTGITSLILSAGVIQRARAVRRASRIIEAVTTQRLAELDALEPRDADRE